MNTISQAYRNQWGSAYVLVTIVLLLLFMMIVSVLYVTSASRTVSLAYGTNAGLYDLAADGNEKALFLLRDALSERQPFIDAKVRERLKQTSMDEHLVYRGELFHLAFPEDGYYASLYQSYAADALNGYPNAPWIRSAGKYLLEYAVTVSYTEDDAETDVYNIRTEIEPSGVKFIVRTTVVKTLNGNAGYPVTVEAEIIWMETNHEEIFVPAFTWRSNAPDFLAASLYASGEVVINNGNEIVDPSSSSIISDGEPVITVGAPPSDNSWQPDRALYVTDQNALDISTLYNDGIPVPTVIIHSGGALRLYASGSASNFRGIVFSKGNVELEDVSVTGSVIAGGDIIITGAVTLEPDAFMLFKVPLEQHLWKTVTDYFGLTRFSETIAPSSDMAAILGRLAFDNQGLHGRSFDIEINNFDAAALTMVRLKQIAD